MTRLAGLAYAGSVLLAAPYLIYSLRRYEGALTRQQRAFSLPLVRLILPASRHMLAFGSLIGYSNRIGDNGVAEAVRAGIGAWNSARTLSVL